MTPVTLPSGLYLFIELPEGKTAKFAEDGKLYSYRGEGVVTANEIPLPSGSYTLIGKSNEISEEGWKGIVESIFIEEYVAYDAYDCHTDYKNYCGGVGFYSALKSGLSLLTHHNLNETTTVILKQLL